jgi:hypothetical protein
VGAGNAVLFGYFTVAGQTVSLAVLNDFVLHPVFENKILSLVVVLEHFHRLDAEALHQLFEHQAVGLDAEAVLQQPHLGNPQLEEFDLVEELLPLDGVVVEAVLALLLAH